MLCPQIPVLDAVFPDDVPAARYDVPDARFDVPHAPQDVPPDAPRYVEMPLPIAVLNMSNPRH